MYTVDEKDYKLLEHLISLNQNQTKEMLSKHLKKNYSNVIETADYLIAEGEIPIALVAHMDTVFERFPKRRCELYYDVKKGIMWSPFGAGFDDRAGIFAILKIIEDGYRPHIIFTCDEEIGSLGAKKLAEKDPKSIFDELKYLIELDRAYDVDCVFYDNFNKDFTYYIESFGFEQDIGTSCDIKWICPEWKISGANLSIGYENQHTASEILNVNVLFSTIMKVREMLDDEVNIHKPFEYIINPELIANCEGCGKEILKSKLNKVKKLDGTEIYYCESCPVKEEVYECGWCGDLIEIDEEPSELICEECKAPYAKD